MEAMNAAVVAGMPEIVGVERTVEVIKGLDGNDVTVYIHRPADRAGALPGVLHLHGGGMVLLEAAGAAYVRLRDELAAVGLVVVGVEFRNGGGKHGPYPYPAGLNDCAAGAALDHRPQGEPRHRQAHRRRGSQAAGTSRWRRRCGPSATDCSTTSPACTRCARTSRTRGRRLCLSSPRCSRTTGTSSTCR